MFARPHRRNFVVARFFTTVPGGRLVWRHRGKHPSANLDEVTDNKTCVPAFRFWFFSGIGNQSVVNCELGIDRSYFAN